MYSYESPPIYQEKTCTIKKKKDLGFKNFWELVNVFLQIYFSQQYKNTVHEKKDSNLLENHFFKKKKKKITFSEEDKVEYFPKK